MSEFKVIETQEELDAIVKARVAREREKFSDYEELKNKVTQYDELQMRISELEKQNGLLESTLSQSKSEAEGYTSKITDLESKVASYEQASLRTKIALQSGLPYDLSDRLQGSDEETLKEDAQRLAAMLKPREVTPPLKDVEPNDVGGENSGLKQMVNQLTNKGE